MSGETVAVFNTVPPLLSLAESYTRYEAIRDRLPVMENGPKQSRTAGRLVDIADQYDGFLFDSFGVLNVGETPIPGAAECLTELRSLGKRICVLTNAASYTREAALAKYQRLGLDVRYVEIVSSRDVALYHLDAVASGVRWSAIAAEGDRFVDISADVHDLLEGSAPWAEAEGFLFLSSARWTCDLQEKLVDELLLKPRPIVIANPDLVAPREDGLTVEPGFWAHDIQDRTGLAPCFFGKPYGSAFDIARERLGPGRFAMIGDTLHTDILGGHSSGFDTVLVTEHGIFSGRDVNGFISDSGIVPTWKLPSI